MSLRRGHRLWAVRLRCGVSNGDGQDTGVLVSSGAVGSERVGVGVVCRCRVAGQILVKEYGNFIAEKQV